MNNTIIKEILAWSVCILITVIVAFLIRHYIGTPTMVQNISMYPTLKQGERLIQNRLSRTMNEPLHRGEIVTFEAPSEESMKDEQTKQNPIAIYKQKSDSWFSSLLYHGMEIGKTSYIKRVIATQTEHITIQNGRVYINGEILEEPYLENDIITEGVITDVIVPENCVFVMGDNRQHSMDSRSFGCIPIAKIESKVSFRIWPIERWGTI